MTVRTVLLCLVVLAPSARAHDDTDASVRRAAVPFGPFASGDERAVSRQGVKGFARAKHPMVGRADKVPGEGPPAPSLRADPDVPETALVGVNDVGSPMSSNPLLLAALFYRHFLTKLDGPRCQHMPTCSRFANQAVARHGPMGMVMAVDRVIQPPQSSAIRSLPQVEGWGGVRFLDPVENYEFWVDGRFTGFPEQTAEEPLALDDAEATTSAPVASTTGVDVEGPSTDTAATAEN